MVRPDWQNLNGEWEFAQTARDAQVPASFEERILVPFAVESALSGVTRAVTPEEAIWYRRTFEAVPREGQRLLLHFGGVDWETKVWVNGKEVGNHRGGYDAFSCDITDTLNGNGMQTVLVRVADPSNHGTQPHGKQALEPGGIVYTAVTGIWQTVWLEYVPETHIASLKLTPDVKAEVLMVRVQLEGPAADRASVRVVSEGDDGKLLSVSGAGSEALRLKVPGARLWSADDPHLYDLRVELILEQPGEESVVDSVESYFGMRSVELLTDANDDSRIFLNGKECFGLGPLDQGWWPDGLYTAPTDEALRWDVELTKKLGFNTIRKHVKVEPARWYYWCDKLGVLVWQDMPSGDRAIGPNEDDMIRSAESESTYRAELKAMIDGLENHPSIIVWVPFNEGWGQFKTNEIIGWIKTYDPTRLVDGPSGWSDRGEGDMIDMHSYPGPDKHEVGPGRASVVGEFGGLGLVVPGHLWFETGSWGYQNMESREELAERYHMLLDNVLMLKRDGLAAAIYTQTTDVEGEVNGIVTYDRKVLKLDPEVVAQWNRRLYQQTPRLSILVPTSQDPSAPGEVWKYTTEEPEGDWTAHDFDDSHWLRGRAGFGAPNTPGAVVRTEWDSSDIWLRRTVVLSATPSGEGLYIKAHHDEDAEVYLDGQQVTRLTGYTTDYRVYELPKEARRLICQGEHVLAVHCHQTMGGQYVDLGLVELQTTDGGGERPASLSTIVPADGRGVFSYPTRTDGSIE